LTDAKENEQYSKWIVETKRSIKHNFTIKVTPVQSPLKTLGTLHAAYRSAVIYADNKADQ